MPRGAVNGATNPIGEREPVVWVRERGRDESSAPPGVLSTRTKEGVMETFLRCWRERERVWEAEGTVLREGEESEYGRKLS